MAKSNLRNYILEYARLLYWMYFKPFTLEQWLKNIHPDLSLDDNFYIDVELKRFPNNQPLRHYADQVFWITALTPQLAFMLVSFIIIPIINESEFLYLLIGETFCIAWIIAQILCRFGYSFFGENFLFSTIISLLLLMFIVTQISENIESNSVLSNVLLCAVLGLTLGLTFGLPSGYMIGFLLNSFCTVVFSLPLSALLLLRFNVVFSEVSSMSLNVLLGILLGILLGMVWIFGALRVYFWLPESLWMILLYVYKHQGKFYRKLQYLPSYFDGCN